MASDPQDLGTLEDKQGMQVELAVVQKSPAGSTGLYFQTQLYLCDPFHAFSLPDLNATHFKKSHPTATRGSVPLSWQKGVWEFHSDLSLGGGGKKSAFCIHFCCIWARFHLL